MINTLLIDFKEECVYLSYKNQKNIRTLNIEIKPIKKDNKEFIFKSKAVKKRYSYEPTLSFDNFYLFLTEDKKEKDSANTITKINKNFIKVEGELYITLFTIIKNIFSKESNKLICVKEIYKDFGLKYDSKKIGKLDLILNVNKKTVINTILNKNSKSDIKIENTDIELSSSNLINVSLEKHDIKTYPKKYSIQILNPVNIFNMPSFFRIIENNNEKEVVKKKKRKVNWDQFTIHSTSSGTSVTVADAQQADLFQYADNLIRNEGGINNLVLAEVQSYARENNYVPSIINNLIERLLRDREQQRTEERTTGREQREMLMSTEIPRETDDIPQQARPGVGMRQQIESGNQNITSNERSRAMSEEHYRQFIRRVIEGDTESDFNI